MDEHVDAINFGVYKITTLQMGFTGSMTANTLAFLTKMTDIEHETSILAKGVFEFFDAKDEKVLRLNRESSGKLGGTGSSSIFQEQTNNSSHLVHKILYLIRASN